MPAVGTSLAKAWPLGYGWVLYLGVDVNNIDTSTVGGAATAAFAGQLLRSIASTPVRSALT